MIDIGKTHWVRVTVDGVWHFYKSCPRCCKSLGVLTYKRIFSWDGISNYPDETGGKFGITEKRITTTNSFGAQSLCLGCRGGGPPSNGLTKAQLERMGTVLEGRWKDKEFL